MKNKNNIHINYTLDILLDKIYPLMILSFMKKIRIVSNMKKINVDLTLSSIYLLSSVFNIKFKCVKCPRNVKNSDFGIHDFMYFTGSSENLESTLIDLNVLKHIKLRKEVYRLYQNFVINYLCIYQYNKKLKSLYREITNSNELFKFYKKKFDYVLSIERTLFYYFSNAGVYSIHIKNLMMYYLFLCDWELDIIANLYDIDYLMRNYKIDINFIWENKVYNSLYGYRKKKQDVTLFRYIIFTYYLSTDIEYKIK